MKKSYEEFLYGKTHVSSGKKLDYKFQPEGIFDFQNYLVDFALEKGRSAIFADCGLGKTLMQMTWSKNVAMNENKPVLMLTPLAVSEQTVEEGEKFGIDVFRSVDGTAKGDITVTNYEKLHLFNSNDYSGVVCDESSILKNFNGRRKTEITAFMRQVNHRLLATATASPNDYTELGTSSEALGYIGYLDMIQKFFRNTQNDVGLKRRFGEAPKFVFKGHSELPFWRWVTHWSRAVRMPSDIGFSDDGYILPELTEEYHVISDHTPAEGFLIHVPAVNLVEQREECKRTIQERCEKVAELVNNNGGEPATVWCHLNDEAKLLKKLIPDCVEVSGSDSDDKKEKAFSDFRHGKVRVLITKPKIGALGLNFQHCNHIVYFPSHSYEQYYQAIRRSWRFGQKRPVKVDIVLTEGYRKVMENLKHKSRQADKMFENLVSEMNRSENVIVNREINNKMELPIWL